MAFASGGNNDSVFDVIKNLESIFDGAFLPDEEEEISKEDFITIGVKTNSGKIPVCFRKSILKLPCFTSHRTFSTKPKIIRGPRHQDDIYRCQMCQFQSKKKVKLQNHMLEVHGETCFFCEHCGSKFKNRNDMKKHVAAVHEGVRYPCTFCDYQAARPPDLKQHINVHHKGTYSSTKNCILIMFMFQE